MKSNWNYPTTIWTGEDRSADIPEACLVAKIKNPLFVTDKDLFILPMTIKTINNLKKVFIDMNVFSNFSGNPVGKNIMEGVEFYNKHKCDGVIAFGGGSALDVGKGIAFMCGILKILGITGKGQMRVKFLQLLQYQQLQAQDLKQEGLLQ